MMRTIHLHGQAGELFGKTFRLDVASLAEVCRALGSQLKGFRQFVVKHDFKVLLRAPSGKALILNEATIAFPLPEGEIHVTPYLQAAGSNSGIGKLIAGIAIAAIAWYAAPALGASLIGGITYGNVALLGVGLAFVGLSQLLTKKPIAPQDYQSFVLNGAQNLQQQGGPVPCVYGKFRVGSVVAASGIYSIDIAPGYIPGSSIDGWTGNPADNL